MMNRVEAENYIYESYNRVAKLLDYDAPDSRKRHPELTEAVLGSFPHVPAVAVTGSKGKGSVCTMISAIMSERVRTGLFTSPHVLRFNERFAVDGREITDGEFTDCVSRVKELFERDRSETDPGRKGGAAGGEAGERSRAEGGREISDREETPSLSYISPIGIEAAVALTFFLDKKTGFNVLECGKGARYDDVNNIAHEYAVITPIFLEHTRELGKTLREIAEDKACIIKEGMRCAFAAAQPDEVMEVLRARAEKCGVPLKVYGTDFRAENVTCSKRGRLFDLTVGDRKFESLFLPLIGSFQAENAALALAVCLDAVCFLRDGSMARHEEGAAGKEEKTSVLKGEEIGHALAGVSRPGRMEIIAEEPLTILDATI
ncbi:MAG: hypothetical protein ILP10_06030, partial [Lachnospiraceae bacterium]|nr:hypothetical protein [Lachnospiraceae bacterium]